MTTYTVTTANWNDPSFWAAISETAGGHTLDFSALPATYAVDIDKAIGRIILTDGTTTFTVGEAGYGGASDASLGGTTLLDYFETLTFGDGNHTATGDANFETITSGSGTDSIDGGGGDDSIDAGGGDDTVDGGQGNDLIQGGDGNDLLFDSGTGGANSETIHGGSGNDRIDGGERSDTVYGGAGDDLILDSGGAASDDTLYGEAGNDTIYGGTREDLIDGGADDDHIFGGDGGDTILGGTGNDRISADDYAPTGPNLIVNGSFEDTTGMTPVGYGFRGPGGTVPGWTDANGSSVDYHNDGRGGLTATDGANWLDMKGGAGEQLVISQTVAGLQPDGIYQLSFDAGDLSNADDGTAQDNTIDVFWNGQLIDSIDPPDGGWQTYTYNLVGGAGDGTGTLEFRGAGAGDSEGASLDSVELYATTETTGANDSVTAGDGNDTVLTGAGDDTVFGGTGDDWIDGGTGADQIDGGAGDDTLTGGPATGTTPSYTDVANGNVATGTTDTDYFRWLAELGSNATITLDDGTGGDRTGDGAADYVLVATANNVGTLALRGFDYGTDRIVLQAPYTSISQTPTFHGGDQWSYTATVTYASGNTQSFNIEMNGTGPVTADQIFTTDQPTGDADVISGGDGADLLTGGSGADTIDGGADADTFVLEDGFGSDAITGGEGVTSGPDSDTIDGGALTGDATVTFDGDEQGSLTDGTDTLDFSQVENVFTGTGDDSIDATADSAGVGLVGGAGTDTITGGSGADYIEGGDGADLAWGAAGDDTMSGDAGADTLSGNAGADNIAGGDGTDSLQGGQGSDTISGGNDGDSLLGDGQWLAPADHPSGGGPATNLTITNSADGPIELWWIDGGGTLVYYTTIQPGDTYVQPTFEDDNWLLRDEDGYYLELIEGAPNQTVDYGATGLNDSIDGDAGEDTIHGQFGDDTIDGGDGTDLIYGGTGDDVIDAGGGTGNNDDTVYGGDGNDTITSSSAVFDSDDELYGEAGDDNIVGSGGADLIDGGTGNDTLIGGTDWDTILGGDGDDSIDAGDQRDSVEGGAGADTITGGADVDYLSGGDDADMFLVGEDFTTTFGDDTIIGGEGTTTGADEDTVDFSAKTSGIDVTYTGNEAGTADEGNITAQFSEIENLTLTDQDDTVDAGADSVGVDIDALDGDDSLIGGQGDDVLNAGSGADTVAGGAGNDQIDLGAGDGAPDTVVVSDGDGADTVTGFEGPIDNGDGTFTGQDQLDLSGATDADGNQLNTRDVTVDDDSLGNALLSLPNGDSITLVGIAPADVTDEDALTAMGVPAPDDIVEGTAGADDIDASYTGDPEGDAVDGADNATGTDADSIVAGAGNDTVASGADNDTVQGEAGDDSLFGGTGNDSLDGGLDNDTLFGQDGDDTLVGGTGNDSLDGDDAIGGDDRIDGGSGDDALIGDDGNDTLLGGDGADDIYASGGDNLIDGGDGADEVFAGSGNDTITVDQGDTVLGAGGDDTFTLQDLDTTGTGNAAISITGGEGGETNGDTLILTSDVSQNDITFSDSDPGTGMSGSFTMAVGTPVTFSEIENIICFTPGTMILTSHGDRPVETLQPGDMVVTRDQGLRPIRWIGTRTVQGHGRFAPIRVGANALDPTRKGLLVSPQHRILYTGYRAELLFGEPEVLVPAKHLVDGRDVLRQPLDEVTYIHLMFDHHEVIYAEGFATESFHAGDVGLGAIEEAAREELFALFPELRTAPGHHLETARPCLKKHEAALLIEDTDGPHY